MAERKEDDWRYDPQWRNGYAAARADLATPDREAAVEALRDYWQRPGVPSAIRKDYPDFANLLEAALAATTPEGDNGR